MTEPNYSPLDVQACDGFLKHGRNYQKKTITKMVKMDFPFRVQTESGEQKGNPGDWLAKNGNGYQVITDDDQTKQYKVVRDRKKGGLKAAKPSEEK
jgi:hypothetical protein